MVAVIGSGVSIRRTFLYNENKVKEGHAICLSAVNYPLELTEMTTDQRLNMLLKTAQLNPDVKRNSIHISLNFAPGEQLSDDTLNNIAKEYMSHIGFGKQPFLVYRHDDAAHPHIHIVTTKIRPDGTRIDTQNVGKLRSEPARKIIEERYVLVKAEDHRKNLFTLKPVNPMRVKYGEEPTEKAINNVLQSVLSEYRFTSIAELNAVLNLYNIRADPGTENSRIRRNNGLIYHVIDSNGNTVGVPVKASAFHNRPGIKFLEKQFLKKDVERQQHKSTLKSTIDIHLFKAAELTLEQLTQKLKMEGVQIVPRQNEQGIVYGLTYVDHRTKCVFNGSTLGKKYSAKGLLERLQSNFKPTTGKSLSSGKKVLSEEYFLPKKGKETEFDVTKQLRDRGVMDDLLNYDHSESVPYQWRKKRRKKKRK